MPVIPIAVAVLVLLSAATLATRWMRRKPGALREASPTDAACSPPAPVLPPFPAVASAKQLWLLDVAEGERVSSATLQNEFGSAPGLGWRADRAVALAVFTYPGALQPTRRGLRLRLEPRDRRTAEAAALSQQAVPLFTCRSEGWIYEGWFRFARAAAQDIECWAVADAAEPDSPGPNPIPEHDRARGRRTNGDEVGQVRPSETVHGCRVAA